MCGIAGFCNMPENWRENITKMNNRMLHRGPDQGGIWANDDATVVFGHRRLSILDLSPTGAQPMCSASERFVMVLNGEIYNYRDIAEKLLKENHISMFRGTSDTEVLLEAVEAYGVENAIKLAKGMFAAAVYDRKEKKIFLVRDRMGEKPLYYGFIGNKFIFASDIAAIRQNSNFEEQLNYDALALYFAHGYIPAPFTVYNNIKKLEPGSILELEAPFLLVKEYKYWDLMQIAENGQTRMFKGSPEEAADELERLLKEAVRGQMIADVPTGAFLSGGIDSTAVVSVMQSLSTNKIKTFTIGFERDSYNEAVYAKESAKYLGTDHTELYISDKEVQSVVPKLAEIYGEPFADSSQIPTYLVSKLARESVTVSLSGDGGDELFCGYNIYNKLDKCWNMISKAPYPLRIGISKMINNPLLMKNTKMELIHQYIQAKSGEQLYECITSSKGVREGFIKLGRFPEYKLSNYPAGFLEGLRNNIMLADLQMYHPDDILVKVDRAGMAVSLESRIPFLDKDIVEFAWRLPLKYKNSGDVGKKVLRDVLFRYIPKEMMDRPKKGFTVPINDWLKDGELNAWACELMNESALRKQGILDEKKVGDIWDDFIHKGKWSRQLWHILMFEQWYQKRKE